MAPLNYHPFVTPCRGPGTIFHGHYLDFQGERLGFGKKNLLFVGLVIPIKMPPPPKKNKGLTVMLRVNKGLTVITDIKVYKSIHKMTPKCLTR